jgi:hypothetical protein
MIYFPSINIWAAGINAMNDKEITEYTVCYIFLIESYNQGIIHMIGTRKDGGTADWRMIDRIFPNNGDGADGYHGGATHMEETYPEEGLVNNGFHPIPLLFNLKTFTYRSCMYALHIVQSNTFFISYRMVLESTVFIMLIKNKDPLPKNTFEGTHFGVNLQVSLQIYKCLQGMYFDKISMLSWEDYLQWTNLRFALTLPIQLWWKMFLIFEIKNKIV